MAEIRIGLAGAAANPLTGAVAPELSADLPAGVRLLAYPSRASVFPYTPLDRQLQVLGHIEAALRAEADGCDAVVLDSFGDYGLDLLRDRLAIPVVGCGDAAIGEAKHVGETFTVVTTWPSSMDFIVKQVMRDAGQEAACRAIRSIGGEEDLAEVVAPGGYLSRIAAGEAGLLGRLRKACQSAGKDDGAQSVLLGCTCLSPWAADLARDCPWPVINPRLAGVRQALRLVEQGAVSSGEGFRPESLGLLFKMLDAVSDTPPEACPTCIGGPGLEPQISRGA